VSIVSCLFNKGFLSYFTNYISMAITKDNLVFVYRLNDLDSAECAVYYASAHGMDTSSDPGTNSGTIGGIDWQVDGQLVGIACANNEILESNSSFNTNLLNPLKDALANSDELNGKTIWGIVLGYNVPGGYRDGDDIISSTSRISMMDGSFQKKTRNKLYNRSIFKRFDEEDSAFVLICSRIDAPNLLLAKEYIDNAVSLKKQTYVNGKFYFDPYSDKTGSSADEYKDSLIFFKNNKLLETNLDIWSTTFIDPYIDVSIPYVLDDSFVWSWFTNRGNSTFFQETSSLRVFFYNADYDSGYSVREEDTDKWVTLSMNAGYVTSAGSMSDPTCDGFLNPTPFFDALIRGATIGEAYLFSVPYLNWSMSLFGDPLTTIAFYGADPFEEDQIEEHESWDMVLRDVSRCASYLYKQEIQRYEVMETVMDFCTDVSSASLMSSANRVYQEVSSKGGKGGWIGQMKPVVEKLLEYPIRRDFKMDTIDTYLTQRNYKVSRLLDYIYGTGKMSSSNLLPEGWWQFEFTAQEEDSFFVYCHYKLKVYSDSCYSQLAIPYEINSYGIRNWTWEQYRNSFSSMTYSGVPSSHIGRRIRYESRVDEILNINEYLVRGNTYYFSITPYNAETGYEYDTKYYQDIIYT
jgi:uncharacterized protein (TIGR03790 family)